MLIRNRKAIFIFIFLLPLNLASTYQKIKNTTGSRRYFKFSYFVVPVVHNVRLKDEKLTLQENQEVFLHAQSSSSSFRLTLDTKLAKDALLYIFFHMTDKTNRNGYAFRISALPHVPTAFLRYEKAHITLRKTSSFKPENFSSRGWRKIEVYSHKNKHILRIDDKIIFTVFDNRLISGMASIASGLKPVTMDNLSIKSGQWTYHDDFSLRNKNNRYFHPREKLVLFLFGSFLSFLAVFFLFGYSSMVISKEEQKTYLGHLNLPMFLLLPGAALTTHDTLCFLTTFIALLLLFVHTLRLFVRTNTILVPSSTYSSPNIPLAFFMRSSIQAAAALIVILVCLHMFLRIESHTCFTLESCPRTLMFQKRILTFNKDPFFLADSLIIRNPALSFDVYGQEGLAVLVTFNKCGEEALTPHDAPDDPVRDGYAMLLSFHKTLPTLLMKNQNIVKASSKTPLLKNKWNHVEILTSGRNILFIINGKQVLSYKHRKIFCGGVKVLPVYQIPEIKNMKIYRLNSEPYPTAFNVIDIVFFLLRLATFLFLFLAFTFLVLYLNAIHFSLSFFLKRGMLFFSFPFCLWGVKEILQHSNHPPDYTPFYVILNALAVSFMVLSYFLLNVLICKNKRINLFYRNEKIKIVLLTLLFLEGFCFSVSPYLDAVRKPYYAFVHDKKHFWYFDPQIRLENGYFSLNRARSASYGYKKHARKRIVLLGSSSAQGQFFTEPSSKVFSTQLERKLLQHNIPSDVLNFAIPGSTSFTGLVFLKGIYPLFKPDIVLWNYCINDPMFVRGNLQKYSYLENVYKQKKYFFLRLLYSTYSFQMLAHIRDSTWLQILLYLPRPNAKQHLYSENLRAVYEFCKKQKIRLVIVHETSDHGLWFEYDRKQKKLLKGGLDRWYYDLFRSFSKKHNIPYVFTVPELVKHREDRLYLDPIHYSKAGHDVMANMLLDFLVEKKLLQR